MIKLLQSFIHYVRTSLLVPWTAVLLLFGALTFLSVIYNPSSTLQSFLHEDELLSAMRVNLLQTIEAEKNAVLATTDEASIDFADQARKAAAKVENGRQNLESIVAQTNSSEDKQTLTDFNSSWAQFQTREHEILELATLNTNIKAQKISSGQCARDVKEIQSNLTQLIQQRVDENRTDNSVRFAYQALTASLNILALHQPHIFAVEDEEMDKIEREIHSYDKEARSALTALELIPDLADNNNVKTAKELYDHFIQQTTEVLRLSRMNTNIKSTELSWGKQNLVAGQCENLLASLQESVRHRQWGGTK